uniref:Major facilitator superfamily (MFS) profile domain-containing protein n=1 Tax=Hanusia phi TaxID=3032 RepID=A0A7S0H9D2_9CRYP|mmetsp:Transcript_12441/g.28624  ORF Transcript_12441/g.28624 Transcript_12441/m.28624 type:complete len:446 (+) Transcript_12441:308-1645(+)|eukprot:767336-Hanusia_phi.AAC.1
MGTQTCNESEGNHEQKQVKPTASRNSLIAWLKDLMPKRWEMVVIVLTIAPMAGFTIMNPYQQTLRAKLDCGALCVGSMTSVSSALGLFGSPLVGALSDHLGRRFALALGALASALSMVILAFASSLFWLWLSVIPGALLAHNFTIAKAVVADLVAPGERAGVLGKLGLAAGFGFMVGPLVHPFVHTHMQAAATATVLNLVAFLAVFQLPSKASGSPSADAGKKTPWESVFFTVYDSVKEVFVLAFAAPACARVILFLRFGLSMGFHIFFTLLTTLLKERFHFQPKDYSNYFAFIGLMYAISQLLSRSIINRFDKDQTKLVVFCVLLLGGGRYVTAQTHTPAVLYSALSLTVMALGIVNTSISATVTRISSSNNVGGLMGVLDTSEKLAGVIGPSIGGALYAYHPFSPVVVVVAVYSLLAAMVFYLYPLYVVPATDQEKEDKEKKE